MNPQTFQLIMWILGILVSILIALVAYVWKSAQAEIRVLRSLYESASDHLAKMDTRISSIEVKCLHHDHNDVNLESIRSIIKQELQESMAYFAERIKLQLLEEGYIQQLTTKQRTRVRAKTK